MKNTFKPSEIPILSSPVTSLNLRNIRNHPAVSLGNCTPFQLFESTGVSPKGTVCIIGNPAKGIGIAKALIRRSRKPFLFLGTGADSNSPFSTFNSDWTLNSAQEKLPSGSGAIYFKRSVEAYSDIEYYLEAWGETHFIIAHIGTGLQVGAELMNKFNAIEQSLLFCESVPRCLRNAESRTFAPSEFLKQISYLIVFSSGSETEDLIQLLPKYEYERVTDTMGVNTFRTRSFFHPFHSHRGHGLSASQSRTLEFNKNMFEHQDLHRLFAVGIVLIYNAENNTVFLARII